MNKKFYAAMLSITKKVKRVELENMTYQDGYLYATSGPIMVRQKIEGLNENHYYTIACSKLVDLGPNEGLNIKFSKVVPTGNMPYFSFKLPKAKTDEEAVLIWLSKFIAATGFVINPYLFKGLAPIFKELKDATVYYNKGGKRIIRIASADIDIIFMPMPEEPADINEGYGMAC